jgi:hypothetical protein
MEFVDLQGASGQGYRFRRWPRSGQHTPMAGQYVILHTRTREVLALGALDNLALAIAQLGELATGTALFTRLNVSRAHREADHADLAAAYPAQAASAAA